MKLYHTTFKSLGLREGSLILPSIETGNLREKWRTKNLDVVFLTSSLHSAKKYAKKIEDSVIFEVHVDSLDFIGRTHGSEYIAHKAKIINTV